MLAHKPLHSIVYINVTRKGNRAGLVTKANKYAKKMSTISAADNQGGLAPGIPPTSQFARHPNQLLMDIKIPDISRLDPELPIQIPYVPDFWASSIPANHPQVEQPLPKLLVVAGVDTHPGGGPSHNLHDENALSDLTNIAPQQKEQGGLWDDIAEDVGLPSPKAIRNAFRKMFS